jgi:hypothetical protein
MPHTEYGPTTLGWRGGATNLKISNPKNKLAFTFPPYDRHERIGF